MLSTALAASGGWQILRVVGRFSAGRQTFGEGHQLIPVLRVEILIVRRSALHVSMCKREVLVYRGGCSVTATMTHVQLQEHVGGSHVFRKEKFRGTRGEIKPTTDNVTVSKSCELWSDQSQG